MKLYQNKVQGYKPSIKIKLQRFFSRIICSIFRIHGSSRWGNEFIQQIDPKTTIKNPLDYSKNIIFRTGHGRLFWRAKETPTIEPETLDFIKNLDEKSVLYDIGANVGVYSIIAAQYSGVRVFSFEPDYQNISILHQNIDLNNLLGLITIVPFSLSEKTSLRSFYNKTVSPGDALHSIDSPSYLISEENLSAVKLTSSFSSSIDNLIYLYNLPPPTHLKLDVDGVEPLILAGSKKTFTSIRSLIVECDFSSNHFNEISELLTVHGFHVKFIAPAHQDHNDSSKNVIFDRE